MDKRDLPRHIDGRIKIGPMPIKNFLLFLPFLILGIIIIFNNLKPHVMFITLVALGFISMLFSEFNKKETGLDIIKDIIRYKFEGDITFERSCINIEDHKRIIFNEIKNKTK